MVTGAGVLVIDTGPTVRVAQALHRAIRRVTRQPVKWVLNTNGQNHRWLGNAYFARLRVPVLAHQEADRMMREMGPDQLQSVRTLLQEKAQGTELSYPTVTIGDRRILKLGKTEIQLLHFGPAHTAADVVVWLPQRQVAFAGDMVYTERLLAVLPIGDSAGWIKAFDSLAALRPKLIVPGHGGPTDLVWAMKETRDYLSFIRQEVRRVLARGGSLQDAVEQIDQSRFAYLANFEQLAKRNVNRIYIEMEQEAF